MQLTLLALQGHIGRASCRLTGILPYYRLETQVRMQQAVASVARIAFWELLQQLQRCACVENELHIPAMCYSEADCVICVNGTVAACSGPSGGGVKGPCAPALTRIGS